jgi:F-type H+-transporting ATPase subunit a
VFHLWFPYIAALFLFIAVSNLISFIPLPISHERGGLGIGSLPDFGLYAATANINVTLALTILTFVIYNVEGVRAHGPIGYVKTLWPDAPRAIQPLIFALEMLSQLLRLVSLSVRLFANLLAGHLLIIMSAGFVILLGNYAGLIALPFGLFFYFFEWVLIAGLQAFIFAMLSGIYIGFAVEQPH